MKTVKTTAAVILFAASLLFVSCDKNKQSLPVDFEFVLLDTLGNEKTVFKQGENIIFSFRVKNNSDEDLYLKNSFIYDDFFKVYQTNTPEGTLSYGRPYNIICYIGGFHLPANETYKMNCPWYYTEDSALNHFCLIHSSETTNLPAGFYYTEFTQSFEIEDIQTEKKHFKINFTVE
jgi:hypothetical protein